VVECSVAKFTLSKIPGGNQVPAGFDGGDGGENHVPSALDGGEESVLENGKSSSLSHMSAQRSEASPATEPSPPSEPSELAGELPIAVVCGLPKSVDLKLPKYVSVYAR